MFLTQQEAPNASDNGFGRDGKVFPKLVHSTSVTESDDQVGRYGNEESGRSRSTFFSYLTKS